MLELINPSSGGYVNGLALKGMVMLHQSRWEDARKVFEEGRSLAVAQPSEGLAFIGARLEEPDMARQLLNELQIMAEKEFVDPIKFFWLYYGLEDFDEAFRLNFSFY